MLQLEGVRPVVAPAFTVRPGEDDDDPFAALLDRFDPTVVVTTAFGVLHG